jgi:hypothetical protein
MAPQFPPTPQSGTFPPSGPTTLTETIPAYLYEQYADDDDLQAFVDAYNGFVQGYVTWFATVPLAAYTNPAITGMLLDWVMAGIYGFIRPTLSSGKFRANGPYNTFAYNTWPFDKIQIIGPSDVAATTDDIFKRIATWNFYKGDGNRFNVRWLKRRIMRFLIGDNGSAPNIDNTYQISITFGENGQVSIRLALGTRKITGGAMYNRIGFNQPGIPYNGLLTQFENGPDPVPNESVLKEAIEAGVLQLPFQFQFMITVPGS